MGQKLRITVTREWEPDPDSYRDVEWPKGSGERRDLTTAEEMAAFEQASVDGGDFDFGDYLDADGTVTKVEVVQSAMTQPVTDGHAPSVLAGLDNPFTEKDESVAGGSSKPAVEVSEGIEYNEGEKYQSVKPDKDNPFHHNI